MAAGRFPAIPRSAQTSNLGPHAAIANTRGPISAPSSRHGTSLYRARTEVNDPEAVRVLLSIGPDRGMPFQTCMKGGKRSPLTEPGAGPVLVFFSSGPERPPLGGEEFKTT